MIRAISSIFLLLLLGACGGAHPLTVPADFVVLEDDYADYDVRATNAHGAVMAVRTIDNDVEGNLSFWVDAVKNKLRTQGGYALLEEGEVRAASGQEGHQMRFGRDQNGQAYQYWVTLFVTPDAIWLVEAGGRGEVWEQAAPHVERSIATLTID
jgi:hypothetical protein